MVFRAAQVAVQDLEILVIGLAVADSVIRVQLNKDILAGRAVMEQVDQVAVAVLVALVVMVGLMIHPEAMEDLVQPGLILVQQFIMQVVVGEAAMATHEGVADKVAVVQPVAHHFLIRETEWQAVKILAVVGAAQLMAHLVDKVRQADLVW
jgi:hypothetical protein